jgi:uncharacterized membrane protein
MLSITSTIAVTAVIFILLDSGYLYLMSNYFNRQIKSIQGSPIKLNITASILCYISLIFGLYYFIIRDRRGVFDAFLLGLVIYSVYDLTTLALLKNWFVKTAVIDSLWGGILFAMTTGLVYRLHLTM